jgi:AcrR family transcriptional regulator
VTAVNKGWTFHLKACSVSAMTVVRKNKTKSRLPQKGKAERTSYRHGNLREALISEAVKMMEERADSEFTLREAAQRIRVSHTAAYRHFPNKGALLAEMANRGFAILAEGLAVGLADGKSTTEVICLQARAYIQTALKHPALFRCMFGPRKFGPENDAAVDASCDVCFDHLMRAATRLKEEYPAITLPVSEISLAIWSMIHGLTNLTLDGQLCDLSDGDTAEDYARLAERAARQLLTGLIPSASRR